MTESLPSNNGVECPVCFGTGWLSGPQSRMYDPNDPWLRKPLGCDECERTGVVSAVRAAGLMARAEQKVLPIIDKVMPELAAAAKAQAERQMRDLGFTDA